MDRDNGLLTGPLNRSHLCCLCPLHLVPEHFSSPLHMAVELGYFEQQGVIVERICCPGGTGEVRHQRGLSLFPS